MRLNAFLAQAGVASRRGADDLIKAGQVTVNGRLGQLHNKVSQKDIVKIKGQPVNLRKSRYILLNKPAGYVTTLKDEKNRPKVTDLIRIKERVVPVGRLDYDTSGLLLLTNDGDLAHRLMHPSFEVDKVYVAEVKGTITLQAINRLKQGVMLNDGRAAAAKATKLATNKVKLTIHQGRKHQIKRMLAAVGLPVVELHRSGYGRLTLAGLNPGQWRDLSPEELSNLG